MSENHPLQSIFKTFEKFSHHVQIHLSHFLSVSQGPLSPQNENPISPLSSNSRINVPNSDPLLLQPKNTIKKEKAANPVTKEELGRATWTLLHTLAAQYPNNPTRQQKKDVKELMAILSRIYPCKECADHFKEVLRVNPVQVGSQAQFSQWLCDVHNVVNRSLGKLIFPCERVDARWGKLDCENRACDLLGNTAHFGDTTH